MENAVNGNEVVENAVEHCVTTVRQAPEIRVYLREPPALKWVFAESFAPLKQFEDEVSARTGLSLAMKSAMASRSASACAERRTGFTRLFLWLGLGT
jgi:hypothetical protein